jgi:hypothetical protein
MAEIVNIKNIDPNTFEFQEYSPQDTNLINSTGVQTTFDPNTDNVEYFIYDLNGNILFQNANYPDYGFNNGVIILDPEKDLRGKGYTEGNYNTTYNFVKTKLGSTSVDTYFISQISPDRTEVRLDTTRIPNDVVVTSSIDLTLEIANSTQGYYDFYLNFGNNDLVIANNVLLDNSNTNNPTVLIKLYEPLPQRFGLQSQCYAVAKVVDSVAYNIEIVVSFDIQDEQLYLQGPNLNIALKDQTNNSTDYANLNTLSTSSVPQGSGSYQYQLNNLLAQTGVTINIDYSDYANFIHFSSAQTRLENFYYKLSLIENYQTSASLSSGTSTNYYVSSSNIIWQSKINEIITGFDGYEYYLYYNSGSTSWPKSNSTPPYTNVSTTSIIGDAWIISQSLVAEQYDLQNKDALIYAIPSYLLEDPDNDSYKLFVEMIGQFFDNIYTYIEGITEKYNADNRVNYGVSKDLVADILRDMGIKIYQNNFSTNDLYSALLGFTPSGSLYNLPFTTTTLPTPSGYEYINTYITASATGSLIPTYDINAEIYKRIYNNLPYLLKKKGTVEGLKALITLYGIPDTILNVNEFGGQDKDQSSIDYWLEQYDYAYSSNGASSGSIYIPFKALNGSFGSEFPRSLQFRFKTDGLPTSSIPYSQSLIASSTDGLIIALEYTGSGYATGSYSGSAYNNDYLYANLKFIFASKTASIYLPFFDGNWWSVMLNADTNGDTTYTLYAGSKTEGYYGGINYEASSSFTTTNFWNVVTTSNLILGSGSIAYGGKTYKSFSGSYQEFRYYSVPLSTSIFESYVVNPYSIEGNNTVSTKDTLAFRLPLGGELYTGSASVHPAITGSSPVTQSFALAPYTASFSGAAVFNSNTETFYFNQPPAGIKNIISNKVRNQSIILPYSSSQSNIPGNTVLSPYRSIQQNSYLSSSFTQNVDYVEVAFSPQNVVNNDIAEELGYFNIGEYIGDPRLVSSSAESYPALDALRDYYFSKYTGNYNIWDYIRLIKYFDNSLFKMIADWVPARTDLASGIVIKQTILERNKYPVPQANISTSLANVGSGATNIPYIQENILFTGSTPVETTTAGNGGVYDDFFITSSATSFTFTTSSIILSGSSLSTYTYTVNVTESGPYTIRVTATDTPAATNFYIYDGDTITGTNIYSDYNTSFDVYLNVILTNNFITFENNNGPSGEILTLNSVIIQRQTPLLTNLNQVWTGSTMGPLGPVGFTESFQYEFFDGELSGSTITVTTQSLNPGNVLLSNQAFYPTIGDYQNLNVNTVNSSYNITNTIELPLSFSVLNRYINYYNTSSFTYSPNFTSVTDVVVNITGSSYLGLGDALVFYFNENNNIIESQAITGIGSFNAIINVPNFTVKSGSTYTVTYDFAQTSILTISASINPLSNWTVNAVNPQVIGYPNDPNIYQQSTFPGNLELYPAYNAVLNNAVSNRLSDKYFDVDYTQNNILPVNQNVIISQSAVHAQVQDSNYTSFRNISPRYLGSKNTSAKYNIYTSASVNTPLVLGTASVWPGDQSYGKTAAIDKYADYFAYFDWIGGSNPEFPGGGNIHLTYLIDIQGNAYPLTGDNKWLDTVSNIFLPGQKASISPVVYSAGSGSIPVTVIEGGAIIDTLAAVSSSLAGNYSAYLISGSTEAALTSLATVFTQTGSYLTEENVIAPAWLYPLVASSSLNISGYYYNTNYYSYNPVTSGFSMINKSTLSPFDLADPNNPQYVKAPFENTYFVIQPYDLIRFGTFPSGSLSSSLDQSFYGDALYQVTDTVPGANFTQHSFIYIQNITGSIPSTVSGVQNWRMMRRVPKDNFVLVQYKPGYTDPGFLIPNNFNPNYDPYTLAKKAGLIA